MKSVVKNFHLVGNIVVNTQVQRKGTVKVPVCISKVQKRLEARQKNRLLCRFLTWLLY